MADCAALEMPCPGQLGPGVRIPLSPLKPLTPKALDERQVLANSSRAYVGRLLFVQNFVGDKPEADPQSC